VLSALWLTLQLGAERLAPPVPDDVKLSEAGDHFLSSCFIVDPAQRPTATELMEEPLMKLDPAWSFADSALSRCVAASRSR